MGLRDTLVHLAAQPVGWAARAVGSAQNVLPGQGDSSLNQIGRAITDPNAVLSNPSGLFTSENAFTDPSQQQQSNQQSGGSNGVLGAETTYDPYSASAGGSGGLTAADLAYLADQEGLLRQILSTTGQRLNEGLTQLGDDYNKETDKANLNRSRFLQDVGLKTEDTTRAKGSALERVDTNARTLANSVRQRLGLASGSGSSAYQLTAPSAIARDASLNRSGVQEDYGTNFRNLDLSKKRATEDFDTLLRDLADQKAAKERGLREGILSQEQGIQGSLADIQRQRVAAQGGNYDAIRAASAPYQQQIADRQAQIDSLFSQFRTPYNVRAVDTSTPSLKDYTVDRANIGEQNQPSTGPDPTSPYAKFLKEEEDKKLVA